MQNLLISPDIYAAAFSKAVIQEYNKLIQNILEIPPSKIDQKNISWTQGRVSVRDLIAYQIGWGNYLIYWYQSGINNQPIKMPGLGFSSWDYNAMAKYFYKKYSLESFEIQLSEFHNIVLKILAIIETENKTGNLLKTNVWTWCTLASGKQWPLQKWIQVNTVAPYKRARNAITRLIKIKLNQ